jgi:hypothetical protein
MPPEKEKTGLRLNFFLPMAGAQIGISSALPYRRIENAHEIQVRVLIARVHDDGLPVFRFRLFPLALDTRGQ